MTAPLADMAPSEANQCALRAATNHHRGARRVALTLGRWRPAGDRQGHGRDPQGQPRFVQQAAERDVPQPATFAPHADLGAAPRVDDEAAGPLLFDGEGDTGHADSVMASGAAAKRIRKSLICKVCETPQNTVFLVSRESLKPNKINKIE